MRVEEGEGKAVLDGVEHKIKPGFAILVPAGARHNMINGPSGPMKLNGVCPIARRWLDEFGHVALATVVYPMVNSRTLR